MGAHMTKESNSCMEQSVTFRWDASDWVIVDFGLAKLSFILNLLDFIWLRCNSTMHPQWVRQMSRSWARFPSYPHQRQGRSQPHSPGWARVPLSSFSLKFRLSFLIFPQTLLIFFLILALRGRVAHPGRPWLRHWSTLNLFNDSVRPRYLFVKTDWVCHVWYNF